MELPQTPEKTVQTFTETEINALRMRVLAIERGELPPDAVSPAELSAAIEFFRNRYKAGGTGGGTKPKAASPIHVDLSDLDL